VWFNRGVAASQAYTAKFSQLPDDAPELGEARWAWLSRGLGEAFIAFIERAAGSGWSLRGAFYEFTWAEGLNALKKAAGRGVNVRLVVHGRDKGVKDHTAENAHEAATKAGLASHITWRTAVPLKDALQHNKFLVLIKGDEPIAVWTGSTNLTEGAIFGHSNLGHTITDPVTAASFLSYWQQLAKNTNNTADLRTWSGQNNPVDTTLQSIPAGIEVVFSPRTGLKALQWYADLMRGATSSAHMTGAFRLNQVFHDVFAEDQDIVRTVLLEKQDAIHPLRPGDPDVRISVGAALEKPVANWVKEHLTGFNVHVKFVHTKIILVNPLTDTPLVMTGSANYSEASTNEGEEHTILISGNTRVADIYLTEYHRLFMHFVFRRWFNAALHQDPNALPDPLVAGDGWSEQYWSVKWRARQREFFAGTAPHP
jgi:phosphatidylserine/phosphatidylglycerophosphate/cardiolipin synthase-like enzyme